MKYVSLAKMPVMHAVHCLTPIEWSGKLAFLMICDMFEMMRVARVVPLAKALWNGQEGLCCWGRCVWRGSC